MYEEGVTPFRRQDMAQRQRSPALVPPLGGLLLQQQNSRER